MKYPSIHPTHPCHPPTLEPAGVDQYGIEEVGPDGNTTTMLSSTIFYPADAELIGPDGLLIMGGVPHPISNSLASKGPQPPSTWEGHIGLRTEMVPSTDGRTGVNALVGPTKHLEVNMDPKQLRDCGLVTCTFPAVEVRLP